MFYRVILDCRPTPVSNSRPFISIKFVNATSEQEAVKLATEKTTSLMQEKGFEDSEIAAYQFASDDVEPFDPKNAVFDSERSLIYYSES